jgi:hypothetical protein
MSLMLSHHGLAMAGGTWLGASSAAVQDLTLMNGERRLES